MRSLKILTIPILLSGSPTASAGDGPRDDIVEGYRQACIDHVAATRGFMGKLRTDPWTHCTCEAETVVDYLLDGAQRSEAEKKRIALEARNACLLAHP
jgi:hypothetical protein